MRKLLVLLLLLSTPSYAAVEFNGAASNGAQLNCGSSGSLDDIYLQGGGGMTVSFWELHRSAGGSNFGLAVGKVSVEGLNEGYWIIEMQNSATRIHFQKNFVVADLNHGAVVGNNPANTWEHIVVTWDGSLTAANSHIYINGVETTYTTATDGSGVENSDAAINLNIGNNDAFNGTWDGFIDDLAIWNVILTQKQIRQLALSRIRLMPLQIQPNNLKIYQKLDDAVDRDTGKAKYLDLTPFHNDCTPTNSPKGKASNILSYP